jgi:hypothetical protein
MKKPLHAPKEQFLLLSKGKLIGWGKNDARNLIINANRARAENLISREDLNGWEFERLLALQWLDVIIEKGVNGEVVKWLNSRIQHVRYHHVLKHSPGTAPYWLRIANADEIKEPEVSIAYAFAQLLAVDAFSGLKRCREKACLNFFIGRPDSKWCSKSCGSRHRVTKKRKRDKS